MRNSTTATLAPEGLAALRQSIFLICMPAISDFIYWYYEKYFSSEIAQEFSLAHHSLLRSVFLREETAAQNQARLLKHLCEREKVSPRPVTEVHLESIRETLNILAGQHRASPSQFATHALVVAEVSSDVARLLEASSR